MRAVLERWRQDRTAYRIRIGWGLFVLAGLLVTSGASILWSWPGVTVGIGALMIGSSMVLAALSWVVYVWVSLWILDVARAPRNGGSVRHTKVF